MSRRTERIGSLLKQTIGEIILRELSDPCIDTARTSVTRVTVQEDLLRAKVYVSIMGAEAQQRTALRALERATGRVEALCMRRVQLRHMPAIEFLADEQFKGALKTWEIIGEAMAEIHAKEAGENQRPQSGEASESENGQHRVDGENILP